MKFLGNILWLLFGGLMIAIEYLLMGVIFIIFIITIPFGLQCFKLARLAIWPFGSEVVYMENSPGCLSTVMNALWFITGGIIVSLTHIFWGIILCITVVGIPFGMQHFKMVPLALFPFGKQVI